MTSLGDLNSEEVFTEVNAGGAVAQRDRCESRHQAGPATMARPGHDPSPICGMGQQAFLIPGAAVRV